LEFNGDFSHWYTGQEMVYGGFENKLAFIVADHAGKKQIIEAIRILYEAEATDVNTARTIRGKKAFVRFKAPEGARNLATKLGLV